MKYSSRDVRAGLTAVAVLTLVGGSAPLAAQATGELLASARTHAVAGRTDAALAIYDSLWSIDRTDRAALLGSATTLAWARRFAEARQRYAQLVERWPSDTEVRQGLARLESWSGQLADSERQWRALLASDSLNAELWVELAQVLRWRGAWRAAEVALQRASALDASQDRARTEYIALRAARAVIVAPTAHVGRDTEGNEFTTVTVGFEVPFERGRSARVVAYNRGATTGGMTGYARVLRGSVQMPMGARTALYAEAGAVQLAGVGGAQRTFPVAVLRLQMEPASWATLRTAISQDVLEETALLMRSRLSTQGVSLSAAARLGSRTEITGVGDVVRIEGAGAANTRRHVQLAAEHAIVGPLRAGVRVQRTEHARVATDGYFSPRRHELGEVIARYAPDGTVGLQPRLEAALGQQRVLFNGAPQTGTARRLLVGLGHRWRGGGEMTIGYEHSTVIGLVPVDVTRAVAYRFDGLRAGARLPL